MRDETALIEENAIRAKAHELWLKRGCPKGTAEEDWYQAESILRSQRSVQVAPAAQAHASPPQTDVAAPPTANGTGRQKETGTGKQANRHRSGS